MARTMVLIAALVLAGAAAFLYSSSRVSASDFSVDQDVVIFTAPWCGYCDRARAHLEQREVDFLEIDIEASADANATWRRAGGRGVPLAFFKDQRISGYAPAVYDRLIDKVSAQH